MPPPAYKSHFGNKVTYIQGWGSFIILVLGPRDSMLPALIQTSIREEALHTLNAAYVGTSSIARADVLIISP